MKLENRKETEELTAEELAEVSGGTKPELEARLTSVGQFRIHQYAGFGLLNNEASVPFDSGLEIGEEICVCPATYETKTIKSFYNPPVEIDIHVIVVGEFRSSNFGEIQEVKVWDR